MSPTIALARPAADEHHPYYGRYVARVVGDDALVPLTEQLAGTLSLLARVDEPRAAFRYAPGKWSVKEVIGHMVDTERVFAYRALCFARGDATKLPGFDEDAYVERAGSDERALADLALEFGAVRAATIALLRSLTPESAARRGTANDATMSARAAAWVIAGHELHHRGVLLERYGLA